MEGIIGFVAVVVLVLLLCTVQASSLLQKYKRHLKQIIMLLPWNLQSSPMVLFFYNFFTTKKVVIVRHI